VGDLHAHQVLVRDIHLVVHFHRESSLVDGLGPCVEPGFMQLRECLAKGFMNIQLGIDSTLQATHQFEDKDLSFLFKEIVALFRKGKLSFQYKQIGFRRRDIQFSHITIPSGIA
jgi:hypothetical protein